MYIYFTKSVARFLLLGLLSFLLVCLFVAVATISTQMVASVIEDAGDVTICSILEGPADGLAIIVEVTADTVNDSATGKIKSILIIILIIMCTVETPNKGHIGTSHFVEV